VVAGLDAVLVELMLCVGRAAAGILPAAALLFTTACDRPAPSADTARAYPPGYVVDSIHSPEESLRRFRAGTDSVSSLAGQPSLRELLAEFTRAATARDTAALRAIALDRREFGWLVYPESRLSRAPYRQPPDVAWLMLQNASDGGMRKLIARIPTMSLLATHCPDSVQVEGRMRTVSGCTVRVQTPDNVRDMRLFGRVVELNGRWKIVGYDGDL
jgi:hypothetical protein